MRRLWIPLLFVVGIFGSFLLTYTPAQEYEVAWTPAAAAGGALLEFFACNKQTQETVAATTFERHAECTFDRTGLDAGTNFLVWGHVSYRSSDGTTVGKIRLTTNDFTGTHTGSNNAAVLTDSAAAFPTPNGLKGYHIFNETDNSSCAVFSNTATTVTCFNEGPLDNGTDDDFDTSDSYHIAYAGLEDGIEPVHSSATFPHGDTETFFKRITLDDKSYTMSLDMNRRSGAGNVEIENSSLVFIEEPAGTVYAETFSDTYARVSTLTDYMSLTVNATSTQSYLICASVERNMEDEGAADGVKFINDTDTVTFFNEVDADIGDTTNNNRWSAVTNCAYESIPDTPDKTYKIQHHGDSAADEHLIRMGFMVAIPFDAFGTTYTDTLTADHEVLNTSYVDSAMDQTQTLSGNQLIIAGLKLGNNHTTSARGSSTRLAVGATLYPSYHLEGRLGDSSPSAGFTYILVHGANISGSTQVVVSAASEDTGTGNHASIEADSYLFIGEVP